MRSSLVAGCLIGGLLASPAAAQLVAEQITAGNAPLHLFGGTDADGGVDDWYLSNGVVELIVDDVGPQDDLVPLLGASAPQKQSEAGFTGGSIIDLGRVGVENDQLAQMFTVAGLSTSNFLLYDTISALTGPGSATLRAEGVVLGFDSGPTPVPPSDLRVVTEYNVSGSDSFVTVTTTVTNQHATNTAQNLGGLLDVFIWTSRAIVPFSPLPGRGFRHVALDLGNPIPALEQPPFAAGPGNVSMADGVMDPPTGLPAGEVAYGLLGVEVSRDPDGPGATPPAVVPVNRLFGVSGNTITAQGNLPSGSLPPGGQLVYRRRIYVGQRNDVAAVASPMIAELGSRLGFATGTISGNLDAIDTDAVEASVIATRTGGVAIASFPDGTPVTQFRTSAADGSFGDIRLPVGTYDLEFRAAERDPVVVSGVGVSAGIDTGVSVPPMSALATVELEILGDVPTEGADTHVPGRVTFKGILGTPDPSFKRDIEALVLSPSGGPSEDLQVETFGGGPAQRNFVYLADGMGTVQLRPGVYEAYFSRGPEFGVARRIVTARAPRIVSGEIQPRARRVRGRPRRLVETPDALSADFHIHSARSLDASAPLQDRVASFAAEGIEVMVSTDHDYLVDYAPIIAGLGLGTRMRSIVGNEVTTSVPNPPAFANSIGHINAWPQAVDPVAKRDGAIEDEFVAPNWLFSRLRSRGAEVVQYNHPRAGLSGLTTIGFFTNIGYDPDLPIDVPPNDVLLDRDVTGASGVDNPDFRNIDFDVMEIQNGTSVSGYLAVRRDWFSLLNQTNAQTASGPVPFIAGTGVSDSHRLTLEAPGYARTYVLGVGDDPAALDVGAFNDRVRSGRMLSSTGPFVEFEVADAVGATAELGETLVPHPGPITLRIRVLASNWIPVEEVRIVQNGAVTHVFDATTTPAVRPAVASPWSQSRARVERFEVELPLPVASDRYILVEAGARLSPMPTPPAFAASIVPDLVPLAFTNPIFIDLAGDGFDPPGLPVPMAALAEARAVAEPEPAIPSLDELDPEQRRELLAHLPVHRLVIPESALETISGSSP
jgi:hypothetical protein